MKKIIVSFTLGIVFLTTAWQASWAQSSSLIKVGYLMADGADPSQTQTLEGLTQALSRMGLQAVVRDAKGDSSLYLEMVASLIAERIDVVVLTYLNDEITSSAVRTVRGVKIPAVVVGKKPLVEDYTVSLTSNDDLGGYIAGYFMESYIKTRFDEDSSVAAIMEGDSIASQNRLDGFLRAVNEKGVTILPSPEVATGKTVVIVKRRTASAIIPEVTVKDVVKELLQNQNLRGIFVTSDEAAIEASKTIFDEGRFNDVIVIGYGGNPEALEEIRKNRMVATVTADFNFLGKAAAGLAINAALGTIQYVSPRDMTVPPTVVSKSVLQGEE